MVEQTFTIRSKGRELTPEVVKDALEHSVGRDLKIEEVRKWGHNFPMKVENKDICKHCNTPIAVRNLSGYCDHLHYPENCKVCQELLNPKKKIEKLRGGLSPLENAFLAPNNKCLMNKINEIIDRLE